VHIAQKTSRFYPVILWNIPTWKLRFYRL
jgi:hypothetical protein